MRRVRKSLCAVVCCALVLVACARDDKDSGGSSTQGSSVGDTTQGSTAAGTAGSTAGGAVSFGDLQNVCGPGTAKTATDRGVTSTEIDVSVLSDIGFTKMTEFPDAAEVFTKWCNDAGGINGRKIVATLRDARMTEVRQRVIEACQSDFAIVGGGVAFDQSGVKERLKCLMPEIPAQVVSVQNTGSDLQALVAEFLYNASAFEGYFGWLMHEAYPASNDHIGVLVQDSAQAKVIMKQDSEVLTALGGKTVYSDLYPVTGASDYTPYAQAIKDAGVKGLVFLGVSADLVKVEQALNDIGYKLDWIDANPNAYAADFITAAGSVLDQQNTLMVGNVFPMELASQNPATQQLVDLYKQYKPDSKPGMLSARSFSAFLLFAVAARDCGDQLTRKCMYENAIKYHEWTGGGLIPPTDAGSNGVATKVCWTVMKATSSGFVVVDVKPDTGAYRCTTIEHPYKADYGKRATLADVGKSLDDLP